MAHLEPKLKRILVITNEVPWPASHGARVDQWSRYSGLKDLGWELALLTWATVNDGPSAAEIARMETVFSPTILAPKPSGLKGGIIRLIGLPYRSTHVSARLLSANVMKDVEAKVRAFNPAAVMVDAIYGYPAGKSIADALGVPVLLRSNNIEHQYMPDQARAAGSTAKKIQLSLASWKLESFERAIHHEASWNFDCSSDDLDFWRSSGCYKNSWAPPVFPSLSSDADDGVATAPAFDLVYLGNLYTPNNVEGIRWLFEDVLQRVLKMGLTPSVLIAGSNPADAVKELVAKYPGATLVANPPDAQEVRRKGRILVNPILRGSGINVKSVEMLFENAAVVTTQIGVQGMSSEVKDAFLVADSAADFAEAIRQALQSPYVVDDTRRKAREVFGLKGLANFASELERVIAEKATAVGMRREKLGHD